METPAEGTPGVGKDRSLDIGGSPEGEAGSYPCFYIISQVHNIDVSRDKDIYIEIK